MSRTATAILFAILLVAVPATGCTRVVSAPASEGGTALGTVSMRGTGISSAVPDQAEMSFGVETESEDARQALDRASTIANDIVDVIKGFDVDDEDVQTANVSVYPRMDYDLAVPRIVGFSANVRVNVTLSDIGSVGEIIQAAVAAGANQVHGPTFTLSDDNPTRTSAVEDAVADARMRAEAAAEAAGESLGDVLSIAEAGVDVPPIQYRFEAESIAADGAAPPIEPGEVDLNASVVVVFELR